MLATGIVSNISSAGCCWRCFMTCSSSAEESAISMIVAVLLQCDIDKQ